MKELVSQRFCRFVRTYFRDVCALRVSFLSRCSKMKAFLDNIKKDIKFKFAGSGKKLTDVPSGRAQRVGGPAAGVAAGVAALSRVRYQQSPKVHTSRDTVRHQSKEEPGTEAPVGEKKDKTAAATAAAELECLSESGVYFTCPLSGATLTRSDREARLKEAILTKFEQDAVEASIMMIHTFNKDREARAAVDAISKYVDNVCEHPAEEKYRKIRVSNKVFQEKVQGVEGSREFLQALGFQSTGMPAEGHAGVEEFLVLPEPSADALRLMVERRDRLRRGEPLRAQLDRRPQAFRPSTNATRFELPPEFYNLTAVELGREQQKRSELVERNTALRTKATRERQEHRERREYSYALLRIRLPDGNLLQGTFDAWDRMPALFGFVRDSLADDHRPFKLVVPGSHKSLQESEDVTLVACDLVPAALLTFSWDADMQLDITAAGGEKRSPAILKPELLESIRTLN